MKARNKQHIGKSKAKGPSSRKGQSAQVGGKGVNRDFRAEMKKEMKTRGSSGTNAKTSREELRDVPGDYQKKENLAKNEETFEKHDSGVIETPVGEASFGYENRKEKSPIQVRDDTNQKATERGFEI